MRDVTPAFCFVCGCKLVMQYPGGDPENGPAVPMCRDPKHPTVHDFAQEWAMENLDRLNEQAEEDEKIAAMYAEMDDAEPDLSWDEAMAEINNRE